jgi:uncharacterized protein (TIGR03382 family)
MRLARKLTATLVYLLAVAILFPQTLSWDGLNFLMHARPPIAHDYGHALYIPALRGMDRLFGGLFGSAERSGRFLSALGAAAAFVLLWRRAERAGATPLGAALAAALFATTALFWYEAGSIEPSTWTIAALLLAAEAAESYGRTRSGARLAALCLCIAGAIGFHLVSVLALPWIAYLAARPAPRPPLRHSAIPLALAGLLAALAWRGGRLAAFWTYWMGFVPTFADGVASTLRHHVERGGTIFVEGAPVLLPVGLVCGAWLMRRRPRVVEAAALAFPYAFAFLAFGKPLVGLLLPVTLAFGLLVTEAAGAARTSGGHGTLVATLSLALLAQVGLTLPGALAWRSTADRDRDRAGLLVRTLPDSSVLFAGRLAAYIAYFYPAVPLVPLPELLHEAAAQRRRLDPVSVVHREARRLSGRFADCYLSSEGIEHLQEFWAVDPARLAIDATRMRTVADDPELYLVPIDVTAAHRRHGRRHALDRQRALTSSWSAPSPAESATDEPAATGLSSGRSRRAASGVHASHKAAPVRKSGARPVASTWATSSWPAASSSSQRRTAPWKTRPVQVTGSATASGAGSAASSRSRWGRTITIAGPPAAKRPPPVATSPRRPPANRTVARPPATRSTVTSRRFAAPMNRATKADAGAS